MLVSLNKRSVVVLFACLALIAGYYCLKPASAGKMQLGASPNPSSNEEAASQSIANSEPGEEPTQRQLVESANLDNPRERLRSVIRKAFGLHQSEPSRNPTLTGRLSAGVEVIPQLTAAWERADYAQVFRLLNGLLSKGEKSAQLGLDALAQRVSEQLMTDPSFGSVPNQEQRNWLEASVGLVIMRKVGQLSENLTDQALFEMAARQQLSLGTKRAIVERLGQSKDVDLFRSAIVNGALQGLDQHVRILEERLENSGADDYQEFAREFGTSIDLAQLDKLASEAANASTVKNLTILRMYVLAACYADPESTYQWASKVISTQGPEFASARIAVAAGVAAAARNANAMHDLVVDYVIGAYGADAATGVSAKTRSALFGALAESIDLPEHHGHAESILKAAEPLEASSFIEAASGDMCARLLPIAKQKLEYWNRAASEEGIATATGFRALICAKAFPFVTDRELFDELVLSGAKPTRTIVAQLQIEEELKGASDVARLSRTLVSIGPRIRIQPKKQLLEKYIAQALLDKEMVGELCELLVNPQIALRTRLYVWDQHASDVGTQAIADNLERYAYVIAFLRSEAIREGRQDMFLFYRPIASWLIAEESNEILVRRVQAREVPPATSRYAELADGVSAIVQLAYLTAPGK